MNRDEQRLFDYLEHILEAIERIENYTANIDEVEFLNNKMVQDAVIRNFEVIGEASHNIIKRHQAFIEHYAELPFMPAYEMRNAVAHGYFKVDLEIVWRAIHENLPNLYAQVKQAMTNL